MRALLTPEIVPRLGVVLFKPGRELMSLFTGGRVLIERQPEKMKTLPTGRIADARQPLAEMDILRFFMRDKRVINAAGGINALEAWLLRHVRECQYPHSHYHHHELVTMRHPRLPWLSAGIVIMNYVSRPPKCCQSWLIRIWFSG